MKRSARYWFLMFIALFLLTVSERPLLAKTLLPVNALPAEEIKSLVSDQTAEVVFAESKNGGLIYFNLNGELIQVKNNRLYEGLWRVESSDRLCIRINGKSWKCRMLIKNGSQIDQYIVKKDGNHQRELIYEKFYKGKKLLKLAKAPILPSGTLNKESVIKIFSNKTVKSKTVHKGRVSLTYYDPSGTLEQLRNGMKRYGTWRVTKNGRICLSFEGSQEKCRIIVKEGKIYKKYIVKKSGQHWHSVSYRQFLPGKEL